jgi:hypothetical protein
MSDINSAIGCRPPSHRANAVPRSPVAADPAGCLTRRKHMTVLMTLKVPADAGRLEQFAKDNPTLMPSVSGRGKDYGVISHRFYESGGTVMVVDEWPDEESFQKFFDASPEIKDVMAAAGASAPPEVTFWRKLDLGDEI